MIKLKHIQLLFILIIPVHNYAQNYKKETGVSFEVNTKSVAYLGIDRREGGIFFFNMYVDGGYNFNAMINQNRLGMGFGFAKLMITCQLDHYTDFKYNQFGISPALNYVLHSKNEFPNVEFGCGYNISLNKGKLLVDNGAFIKIKLTKALLTKHHENNSGYE